eukprot:TRINITY_DN28490_c0_g1_i1.p1 TRINITY_DN28490_c0_g1~~TRINITY_DN28490_c0_g1_i1.p1  ORF type:complete len:251 (+),score=54.39 TRINITY_DN28490_c0_g1_i1:149-901(+)
MTCHKQLNLDVYFRFDEEPIRLKFPLTGTKLQIELLHCLSDACNNFLEDIMPEDASFAGMIENGIAVIAQLREAVLRASFHDAGNSTLDQVLEESIASRESEIDAAPHAADADLYSSKLFLTEKKDEHESDEGEGSDGEDPAAPKRQRAFLQWDVKARTMEMDRQSLHCTLDVPKPRFGSRMEQAQTLRQTKQQRQDPFFETEDFSAILPSKSHCTKEPSRTRSALRRICSLSSRSPYASHSRKISPDPS